jgi:hypothetical protein
MLTTHRVSSIVQRQRFNIQVLQTVLMSLGYVGLMMLILAFIPIVIAMPGKW